MLSPYREHIQQMHKEHFKGLHCQSDFRSAKPSVPLNLGINGFACLLNHGKQPVCEYNTSSQYRTRRRVSALTLSCSHINESLIIICLGLKSFRKCNYLSSEFPRSMGTAREQKTDHTNAICTVPRFRPSLASGFQLVLIKGGKWHFSP